MNDKQFKEIVLKRIQCKYSGGHRYYHNLAHIEKMFKTAAVHGFWLTKAQIIAIAYHDIIYNPLARDNELQSAIYLRNDKELFEETNITDPILQNFILKSAEMFILDTEHHIPTEHKELGEEHKLQSAVILDLDLFDLAADYSIFTNNTVLIRYEYKHLSTNEFISNRLQFIKKMLNRPTIFSTIGFQVLYEQRAKYNLERERDELNIKLCNFVI